MNQEVSKMEPAAEQPRFSLFEIESAQLDLMTARAEAEELSAERPACSHCGGRGSWGEVEVVNPNTQCPLCEGTGRGPSDRDRAIAAVDQAIAEYAIREVQKADSYIVFLRALANGLAIAKEDAERASRKTATIKNMIEAVKAAGKRAMELTGKKRIDGRRGYLLLKGNGGVAPLVIQAPGLLPPDLKDVTVRMPLDLFEALTKEYTDMQVIDSQPANERIRAALGRNCPTCAGSGEMAASHPAEGGVCSACAGSGKQAVPGAYIGERGSHLEVK